MVDKVAVITGASGGLGEVLAGEFSKTWHVIGTGRSARPDDLPAEVEYHQFDASESKECEAFWRRLADTHPDSEICLVNNAGGYVGGSLRGANHEDFDRMMRSCYFSAVYMTKGLVEAYPKGKLLNIVSSSALAPGKNDSAYGSAKAAEKHFFQSLQQELEPERYQIVNFYPFNIASHGPSPNAMDPKDLAAFVYQQAENQASFYLRDVTLWPRVASTV